MHYNYRRDSRTKKSLLIGIMSVFVITIFVTPGVFPNTSGLSGVSKGSTRNQFDPLYTNITVGYNPQLIVPGPSGKYLYVVNYNNVSVIDAKSNTVVTTVNLGTGPNNQSIYAAYATSSKSLYVLNHPTTGQQYNSTVSVINSSFDVVKTIAVGCGGNEIGYNPKTKMIYVTNENCGTVSIINTKKNIVEMTVSAGKYPYGLAFSSSGNTYVSEYGTGNVSVISPAGKVTASIALSGGITSMAYDSNNNELFVASLGDGLFVINTTSNTYIKTLAGGYTWWGITYNQKFQLVFQTDYGNNEVYVYNATTNQLIESEKVGNYPWAVANDPKNGYSYIMNLENSSVTVFDGLTLVGSIPVAQYPVAATYSATSKDMYVVSQTNGIYGIVTVIPK